MEKPIDRKYSYQKISPLHSNRRLYKLSNVRSIISTSISNNKKSNGRQQISPKRQVIQTKNIKNQLQRKPAAFGAVKIARQKTIGHSKRFSNLLITSNSKTQTKIQAETENLEAKSNKQIYQKLNFRLNQVMSEYQLRYQNVLQEKDKVMRQNTKLKKQIRQLKKKYKQSENKVLGDRIIFSCKSSHNLPNNKFNNI